MSDLISREAVIELIRSLYPSAPIMRMNRKRWKKKYEPYIEVEKAIEMLSSAEPKTPSNGSITNINTEKMHVRTTDDCISRQDVLHELDGCDYELKDWQRWKLKTMVRDIPSAGGCKCPCEYREPCDYCHYDAYRGHGCPAEGRG